MMEEKILEMIEDETDPYDSYINKYTVSSKIAAHALAFIEWLHDNTDDTRRVTSKKAYKKWWCIPLRGWFTINQLYDYWLTKI